MLKFHVLGIIMSLIKDFHGSVSYYSPLISEQHIQEKHDQKLLGFIHDNEDMT